MMFLFSPTRGMREEEIFVSEVQLKKSSHVSKAFSPLYGCHRGVLVTVSTIHHHDVPTRTRSRSFLGVYFLLDDDVITCHAAHATCPHAQKRKLKHTDPCPGLLHPSIHPFIHPFIHSFIHSS